MTAAKAQPFAKIDTVIKKCSAKHNLAENLAFIFIPQQLTGKAKKMHELIVADPKNGFHWVHHDRQVEKFAFIDQDENLVKDDL